MEGSEKKTFRENLKEILKKEDIKDLLQEIRQDKKKEEDRLREEAFKRDQEEKERIRQAEIAKYGDKLVKNVYWTCPECGSKEKMKLAKGTEEERAFAGKMGALPEDCPCVPMCNGQNNLGYLLPKCEKCGKMCHIKGIYLHYLPTPAERDFTR